MGSAGSCWSSGSSPRTTDAARGRLRRWHLRIASVRPLGDESWRHRHNMSMADAFYVVLADHLGADFLTDDHRLVGAPTFPAHINLLSLPKPASS